MANAQLFETQDPDSGNSESQETGFRSEKAQPARLEQSSQLDSSSGIALASLGDPGPSLEVAARSIDPVAFRPRVSATIIGMVSIVVVIGVAAVMGASPLVMIVVSTAACFLYTAIAVIHGVLCWETAENAYEKERAAAENWNDRFRKLHSDSMRTNSVLSHMIDGVVLLSPTSEIVLINEAARRLLVLPADGKQLGQRLAELIRVPEIINAVRQTRAENVDQNLSIEIVDGSLVRPVAVRISRIMDTIPPHLLLVLRDETESQRVEAIRREFIANVSHELKTPLAAIKGYAETVELAIGDDPDAAKHFIGQIENQCNRLEDLIADMMRLARAQSGKGTLVVQAIDLKKVIGQAMASFLPVAAAKQIELVFQQTRAPVHVMADEEAALTITQNLISNAIRHTEAGGHVLVKCQRQDDGWVMSVQDDGVGIAEEFQERIFERFYRVERTRKTHDGGTGIGLSIVKNLTRSLKGTVRVISQPGDGATFEVWLRSPK